MGIWKSLNLTEQTIDGKTGIHLWLVVVLAGYDNGGGGAGGRGGVYAYADSLLKGSKGSRVYYKVTDIALVH